MNFIPSCGIKDASTSRIRVESQGKQNHPGRIHSINFEQNKNGFFQLQLDDVINEPELYPMIYDAVFAYADECNPSYSSFRLPAQILFDPINETSITEKL